jgi:GST-like protein
MITLYTWTTSNGRKATIAIEETGLPYELRPVNINAGEQLNPDYLKISPNHTIPAIVDGDAPDAPRVVFESGAVLLYLAEKSGKLLPTGRRRDQALAWLFWAASGFATAHGNWRHFALQSEQKNPAEIERGAKGMVRMLTVLEQRLSEQPFVAQDYSIADISIFTRARNAVQEFRKATGTTLLGPTPGIDRWLAAIEARPAVQRGLALPKV